jgi:hypothetical protein
MGQARKEVKEARKVQAFFRKSSLLIRNIQVQEGRMKERQGTKERQERQEMQERQEGDTAAPSKSVVRRDQTQT